MSSSLSAALEKIHLHDPANQIKSDQKKPRARQRQRRRQEPLTPFRFFDLPGEIRLRIYGYVLFTPRRRQTTRFTGSVGASSKRNPFISPTSHRLALFLTSKRMHEEASDHFFSMQTFRLFPLQDYSRMPTIRAIAPTYRRSIAAIELILGSSWTAPPASWTVDRSLGLEDMVRVRTFKLFIEVDPSHPVFEGFRVSEGFYTDFAGELLQKVLAAVPALEFVEFDGWPSVRKSGALMKRLLQEVRAAGKKIAWGPERGWTDYDGEEDCDDPHGLREQEERMKQHQLERERREQREREWARVQAASLPLPLPLPQAQALPWLDL
ncbi:hypothetical protein BO70DRAFT_358573 [Aspergillus heteromorphus CBS 117.55]|uniref:Uncharacterized protein n=1 Tax=Aspergillus heteromorphus CBS 117.55 TaxID=1448321 RepID=A0A317WXL9_9EURO|nr:uncharacterized protein BO70DRAFT_358573 [Aspergillus heteromorphus CBS 117.55]PWY91139.1 hypothetical protein BO70DRAFT_358573 [Aspergillus heteromorphus CBS 117.55]